MTHVPIGLSSTKLQSCDSVLRQLSSRREDPEAELVSALRLIATGPEGCAVIACFEDV